MEGMTGRPVSVYDIYIYVDIIRGVFAGTGLDMLCKIKAFLTSQERN